MYCTRWAMMHLDCLLNNMPLNTAFILQYPPETNIENFRSQLDKIGFCYDWDREVHTSDPAYYKWTQWIFLQLFNSCYNRKTQKGRTH